MTTLKVVKLDSRAKLPKRQTIGAAGYDLYSLDAGTIEPNSHAIVKTGICIILPPNTYGRIASRSGLSAKNMIEVGAGVIDADYHLELMVILYNHSCVEFTYEQNTRIAQLIITKIETPDVEEIAPITDSENIHMGFGSTGLTD